MTVDQRKRILTARNSATNVKTDDTIAKAWLNLFGTSIWTDDGNGTWEANKTNAGDAGIILTAASGGGAAQ